MEPGISSFFLVKNIAVFLYKAFRILDTFRIKAFRILFIKL